MQSFKQTAMYLPVSAYNAPPETQPLELLQLSKGDDLTAWCDIGSSAFGYTIDVATIEKLAKLSESYLYLAHWQSKPAAVGLLFKTGNTLGVHQVSVAPTYQGKGLASNLMHALLAQARSLNVENVVLQASVAGYPLYKKLGFTKQFSIVNYRAG